MATAVEDLQNRLQQHLATHVAIHHGEKRGRNEIEYYGKDDLQRIWVLRKVLNPLSPVEAMELLIDKLSKTRSNGEFLSNMSSL